MEQANKEQAEKCRDLGAAALRRGDFAKAVKMLDKSLKMHPLPGVEALLSHAQSKLNEGTSSADTNTTTPPPESNNNNTQRTASSSSSTNSAPPPRRQQSGSDGRAYTDEQVNIVKKILAAKQGGRGAHYRVLGLASENATENEIKKAYRKTSLKVHPDKNSAPHADEAFKAVGLAYATLSDPQKRQIYDRYGDEDPDNRGGGFRPGGGGMHMRHGGQEMSPEDIFNAFFGGGMAGGGMGGPGVHFYSTGFGPGVHFAGGMPRQRRQQQPRQQQQQQHQQQQEAAPGIGMLMQFLPLILIMMVSFLRTGDEYSTGGTMPGENKYFSLSSKKPFTNPLATKLTPVKDIPYYVSDKFLRTYARDRFQLSQVERMVERAYENFLFNECKNQIDYKKNLQKASERKGLSEQERAKTFKLANEFELSRCLELDDLFPHRRRKKKGGLYG